MCRLVDNFEIVFLISTKLFPVCLLLSPLEH